jgi:hypothetical protein
VASAGAAYPRPRGPLARAPAAGGGTVAGGAGVGVAGQRRPGGFSPPKAGGLYLGVDSPSKGERTKHKPLAKKARLTEYAPYPCGLQVAILTARWAVSRIPPACGLVKPAGSPGSQSGSARLRQLRQAVVRPAGRQQVVVVAAAASPSRADLHARHARGGFFVRAFPRTRRLATGQSRRDLVPPLPLHQYRPVRVPVGVPTARRRVFWPFAQRAEVRQVADVTVVLSRRRRPDRPRRTTLPGTTLPQAPAHLPVALSLRRWPVERCLKGLKGGAGSAPGPRGGRPGGAFGGRGGHGVSAGAAVAGRAEQTGDVPERLHPQARAGVGLGRRARGTGSASRGAPGSARAACRAGGARAACSVSPSLIL